MNSIKKLSFFNLIDTVIYFCCFNFGFYLLNPHHSMTLTIIWWLFCIGLVFIFKMSLNYNIKLGTTLVVIAVTILTNLFSIYTVAFTFAICSYLLKTKQVVTTANIFFFQIFYLFLILYLKITDQRIAEYYSLYLFLLLLLIIRIGIAVISPYVNSYVQKTLKLFSVFGVVMASAFILTTCIVPLFRNLFSWVMYLFTKVIGFMIGPFYQWIAQFAQKRMSKKETTRELISNMNRLNPGVTGEGRMPQDTIGYQYVSDTVEKIFFIILVITMIYGSYRLIKSLRKVKLQTSPINEVSVNRIEQPNILAGVKQNEYTDEIDQLINQIFIIASEKGIPKEENQSIRKWAKWLPFQVPENWIKDFEDIRYNEAKHVRIHSSFIQQSFEIIHKLNQIT